MKDSKITFDLRWGRSCKVTHGEMMLLGQKDIVKGEEEGQSSRLVLVVALELHCPI